MTGKNKSLCIEKFIPITNTVAWHARTANNFRLIPCWYVLVHSSPCHISFSAWYVHSTVMAWYCLVGRLLYMIVYTTFTRRDLPRTSTMISLTFNIHIICHSLNYFREVYDPWKHVHWLTRPMAHVTETGPHTIVKQCSNINDQPRQLWSHTFIIDVKSVYLARGKP